MITWAGKVLSKETEEQLRAAGWTEEKIEAAAKRLEERTKKLTSTEGKETPYER